MAVSRHPLHKFCAGHFEQLERKESLNMQMALLLTEGIDSKPVQSICPVGILPASLGGQRKDTTLMTKTLETITEAIRNPKHPFPQVADRPDKPHKNRYERRKVKQYIQLGNWGTETGA
jgi:hypothetical protein